MGERQNKIVCVFDLKSTHISANEIHEWICAQMGLNDTEMVQIDGPKRHLYMKFRHNNRVQDMLHMTEGQIEYRHTNGEISFVRTESAGMGMRRDICTAVVRLLSYTTSQYAQLNVLLLYSHQSATHSRTSQEISWQLIRSFPVG